MATVALCPTFGAFFQGFTAAGLPLNAGTVNTYAAGSTTPAPTYTTSSGSVQNANPVVLGADGRPPNEVWLVAGNAYRFDVKDSLGNLIASYDNIVGINDAGGLQGALTANLAAGGFKITGLGASNTNGDALSQISPTAWNPTLTFATPGDLAVGYSTRTASYLQAGKLSVIWFNIITSSFTFTTASGVLEITGCPLTPTGAGNYVGSMAWGGITKASYTFVQPVMSGGSSVMAFLASGSGAGALTIAAGDTPTGGTVNLQGMIIFST